MTINKEKLVEGLNNKIKELNDYIQSEYGYDPHFDYDILDELIVITANMVRMGLNDFRLVYNIGYITVIMCGLNDREPTQEDRDRTMGPIYEASKQWVKENPNISPVLKNLDYIGGPMNNPSQPQFKM